MRNARLIALAAVNISLFVAGCVSPRDETLTGAQIQTRKPEDLQPPLASMSIAERSRRLEKLTKAADLIIATEDWNHFRVRKSESDQIVQCDSIKEMVAEVDPEKRRIVIVYIPATVPITPERPTGDQYAIAIQIRLRKLGFQNVIFLTSYHAITADAYPHGLPTEQQAADTKRQVLSWRP